MSKNKMIKINKFCKHHINGIGNDNRPENLALINPKENINTLQNKKGVYYVIIRYN